MVEIADCGRGERATELGHPFLSFNLTNDCETVNVGKVLEIKLDVRPQRTRLPAMKSRQPGAANESSDYGFLSLDLPP